MTEVQRSTTCASPTKTAPIDRAADGAQHQTKGHAGDADGHPAAAQDHKAPTVRPKALSAEFHASGSFKTRRAAGLLHLVIDSTGMKAKGDGEWRAKKTDRRSRGTGARVTSGSTWKPWKSWPSGRVGVATLDEVWSQPGGLPQTTRRARLVPRLRQADSQASDQGCNPDPLLSLCHVLRISSADPRDRRTPCAQRSRAAPGR